MTDAPAARDIETRAVISVIAISLLVRAVLAGVMGFSFDETYNVVVARKLALSYYDHPPAIMWLIAAAVHVAGSEHHLIVRLPTLLLFTAQNWLLYRLTALVFNRQAGLFAVIAISLAPIFSVEVGTIAATDGPLMFALTGATLFVARALFSGQPAQWRDWLLAGLFFGIAMLAKFSAVLILPGLALFAVTVPRHRRLFMSPAPYAAALVALCVFSPVIFWSLQHEFVAFAFQGNRAAMRVTPDVVRALTHLGILIAVIGPVWFLQIAALAGGLRTGPRDERRWFFTALAIVPLGFFVTLDLFGTAGVAGPHWFAPGYLFTFPLAGAMAVALRARFARAVWWATASVAAAIGVILLAYASHVLTGWIRNVVPAFAEYDPLVSDQTDWWNLRATLEAKGMLDPKRYFVLGGRYEFCFKAQLVLNDSLPVVCLTDNPIFGSLWLDDAALVGRDAIIITNWWRAQQSIAAVSAKFERVEPMQPVWMMTHGRPAMRVELAIGRNLKQAIFDRPDAGR